MHRVAWLFEYPTLHGGERSLLAAAPHLQAAGFELVALAPDSGPLAERLAQAGAAVVPFEMFDATGQRLSQEPLRERLAKTVAALRPTLLHANSLAMGRLAGPVAAALKLPSLTHLRDIIKLSRAAVADLNRHARLLAVSHATREFHIAQGMDAPKVEVLYNGVDLAAFRPRRATGWLHARLNIPPGAMLIGAVGQLVLRKGHDVLARAAARLARQLPEAHWLLIGSRYSQKAEAVAYEQSLHETFAAADLGGRAHFLGTVDGVAELLPELTLLVHPSRQEPLGRVLLEAAACGVACIATDVGGTREIFPPASGAARLVPVDNDEALATAVAELVALPDERARLGQAARVRAETQFDICRAAEGLARHYRDVATQASNRA
ncbi:MAG TPA: glycosyltransferase family 4 protein [Pirellulales bacterium]|nr:glycosyltransferase family 4 protein [Pirellulales bacterium]